MPGGVPSGTLNSRPLGATRGHFGRLWRITVAVGASGR